MNFNSLKKNSFFYTTVHIVKNLRKFVILMSIFVIRNEKESINRGSIFLTGRWGVKSTERKSS
jgi:hypothetical protein